MTVAKHRIQELEALRSTNDAGEKSLREELKKLQEELTETKHSLHEEEAKFRRIHRDNQDLHKKLKVRVYVCV
jgi:hypothetical protein